MADRGAFELKWQREHQKLCALDRHESSCGTRAFIRCQTYCVVRHYKYSCSQSTLFWGIDTNGLCNMLCNGLLLCSQPGKLCNTRIASAKCTKWHSLNGRWCTVTHSKICSQGHGLAICWSQNLALFFFFVASVIPQFDSCVFLVLRIHQIQSLHMTSASFVGY